MNVLRNTEIVIYAHFVSAFSEPQTELQFGMHKSTAPPTAVFLCLKIGVGFGTLHPGLLPKPKKTALAEARTVFPSVQTLTAVRPNGPAEVHRDDKPPIRSERDPKHA